MNQKKENNREEIQPGFQLLPNVIVNIEGISYNTSIPLVKAYKFVAENPLRVVLFDEDETVILSKAKEVYSKNDIKLLDNNSVNDTDIFIYTESERYPIKDVIDVLGNEMIDLMIRIPIPYSKSIVQEAISTLTESQFFDLVVFLKTK